MSSLPPRPGDGSGAGARVGAGGQLGSAETHRQVAETAREALRRLAVDRLAPTPDNFRTYFHRISGSLPEDDLLLRALRQGVSALPRHTPELLRVSRQFDAALKDSRPGDVLRAMQELGKVVSSPVDALPWAGLIRRLSVQLSRGLDGSAEGELEQALALGDGARLYQRLDALLDTWAARPEPSGAPPLEAPLETPDLDVADAQAPRFVEMLADLLGQGLPGALVDAPELAAEARQLAADLLRTGGGDPGSLAVQLGAFTRRVEAVGESLHSVRLSLVSLLQLVVSNISELVLDDRWLHGQLEVLHELFSQPLDIRTLDEVERRLKAVISKQGELKRHLADAQARLKEMLAGFVDRLASFSTSTGGYHEMLEACADEIAGARSLDELSDVVARMLSETRRQQQGAERSYRELIELRSLVDSANQQIFRLQRELEETSDLVRHDPLTGLLNRKGLDEALAKEISRARRMGQALCLGLIDVDDFKRINDSCGHLVGDQTLRHLSKVIGDNLRVQDALGRYGGEEFLLILPDTPLDEGVGILTRLQRELTKHFFMAEQRRLLITFSAGVALLGEAEAPESALARADQAMYLAKRAGKNRVFAA